MHNRYFPCPHKLRGILCVSILTMITSVVQAQTAQPYRILIKGGHVIDPKNNINEVMDVAITAGLPGQPAHEARPAENGQPARAAQPAIPAVDGKIGLIAKNINPALAVQVINATGMYVTPGLIDLHTHLFPGAGRGDPFPDGFTLRNGVTTAVDAGSSGWKSFPDFKKETIDRAVTRVLAFLNIGAEGYRRINGRANESDTSTMSAKLTGEFALTNNEHIVGIKVSHYSGPDHLIPIDRGIEAARIAGVPLMLDDDLEDAYLKRFRPGDIYTHTYGQNIMDTLTGRVKPYILDAQKRGIIFDVGFGGNNLIFAQAIPAIKSGFLPNTMGSDMNHGSYNGAMKGLLNVMSTFMAMGMDLQSVVKAATWSPALVIRRPEFGHLSVGALADITVLNLRQGNYGVRDTRNFMMETTQRLECELTIKGGRVVYDTNGMSVQAFKP
jgi:dihydroorotase